MLSSDEPMVPCSLPVTVCEDVPPRDAALVLVVEVVVVAEVTVPYFINDRLAANLDEPGSNDETDNVTSTTSSSDRRATAPRRAGEGAPSPFSPTRGGISAPRSGIDSFASITVTNQAIGRVVRSF